MGVSLKVLAPTGQYDPTKLVNWGTNRWAFKPELGYSRRWGNWILDSYGGAWFYTTNPRLLFATIPQAANGKPYRKLRGPSELRCKAKGSGFHWTEISGSAALPA